MDTALEKLPGYQVNEYKLIVSPHEDLIHRIADIRKGFDEKFKTEQPVKSLPEVALVTFKQLQVFEERLCNRLKLIGMALPPIKIELKDYGSFPSHSIFINVTSKVPITEVIKKIRTDAQKLMKLDNDNKPHFLMESYVMIGRKLKPWQYDTAWLEYSHKSFIGKFIASKMLLLKRREGEFKYRPVASFEFCNMPVETKQGSLFI